MNRNQPWTIIAYAATFAAPQSRPTPENFLTTFAVSVTLLLAISTKQQRTYIACILRNCPPGTPHLCFPPQDPASLRNIWVGPMICSLSPVQAYPAWCIARLACCRLAHWMKGMLLICTVVWEYLSSSIVYASSTTPLSLSFECPAC